MFPLFKNGAKFVKSGIFLLRFVSGPSQNSGESRFCFSVSKKIAKNAVLRNKLRRTGYNLIKKYITKIKPNNLIVFSFQKLPKTESEVAEDIESVLKSSKLIK